MPELVVLPKTNLTMENGLLTCWYKNQGDAVEAGETLCTIETDKAAEDLPSPASGIVAHVWGIAGEEYKVGAPLCLIAAAGEDVSAFIAQIESRQAAPAAGTGSPASAEPASAGSPGFRILPKVRNLAKQNGVTVEQLRERYGEVPVTEEHVEQFVAERSGTGALADAVGERVRLTPMRRAIAANIAESASKTARLTNFMEVDMTAAMERIAALKRQGTQISLTALAVKACALALREHPGVNASLDMERGELILHDAIHVGFAVDVPGGLVVPVIRNADQKTLAELSDAVAALSQPAQDGSLPSESMAGGTFTVSNVGMLGIDSFTPIIRYPEAAILGIGEIKTLPRYLNNDFSAVHPRKIMKIGLTYDHRIVDGAPASRFLQSVRGRLENPDTLF